MNPTPDYAATFKQAPVPMMLIGDDGVILDVNEEFVRAFGYEHAEIPTLTEWALRAGPLPGELVPAAQSSLEAGGRFGAPATAAAPIEATVICRDGRVVNVLAFSRWIEGALLQTFIDVTDQKQRADTCRESEKRLLQLLNAGEVGLWDWDLVTNQVHFSPEWKRQLGFSDGEVSDRLDEWQSRVHPDDLAPTLAKVNAFLAGPVGTHEIEHRMRHKDGSYRWILARADVVSDASGRPVRMLGSHVDITRAKAAEARARSHAETIDFAERAARAGTWRWDMVSNEFDWSAGMFRLFGLDRDTDVGSVETWLRTIHPDDIDGAQTRLAVAVETKSLLDSDYRVIRPGGEIAWVKALGEVVCDDAANPVHMAGICIDITREKEAERERHAAEEALRLSEERFKFAIEGSGYGVWDYNPTTDENYFSPRYARMLGYDESELRPTGEEWSSRIHPDDRERTLESVKRHLDDPTVPYEVEHRLRCKDGSYRWFRARGLLVERNREGQPWRMTGTINDITDRKKAEEELLEARDLLADANVALTKASRMKDEFFSIMSHELRTPLNAVIATSETLLEQIRGPLNERQEKSVRMIESSGRRMLELVIDLLDYAGAEAGLLALAVEDVPISEICRAAIASVSAAAERKKIRLSLQTDDHAAVISADRARLGRILENLVSNAVKFTPEGGSIKLAAETDRDTGIVQFRVDDSGIGIAPEDIARLFLPFTQLDSSLNRKHDGTGMGLALVRRLADLHGGSVGVESEPGKGSRFTLSLPLTTAHTPVGEALPEERLDGRKILLAEDSAHTAATVQAYLEELGCEVFLAADGAQAAALAASAKPDLILMDVQLPVLDGLQAITLLRSHQEFASTPIIALTNLAMPGGCARCREAGATESVIKPLVMRDLVERIRRLLPVCV